MFAELTINLIALRFLSLLVVAAVQGVAVAATAVFLGDPGPKYDGGLTAQSASPPGPFRIAEHDPVRHRLVEAGGGRSGGIQGRPGGRRGGDPRAVRRAGSRCLRASPAGETGADDAALHRRHRHGGLPAGCRADRPVVCAARPHPHPAAHRRAAPQRLRHPRLTAGAVDPCRCAGRGGGDGHWSASFSARPTPCWRRSSSASENDHRVGTEPPCPMVVAP